MKKYMFAAFKIDKNDQGEEIVAKDNPYLEKEIQAENKEAARNKGIQILLRENPDANIDEYTTHISFCS